MMRRILEMMGVTPPPPRCPVPALSEAERHFERARRSAEHTIRHADATSDAVRDAPAQAIRHAQRRLAEGR